jgi:antitoxin HigA-1
MPMKNPVHPGRVVRHDCLEPLGLSVTAGAKVLCVTRQALNNVVNGKAGISPEMAIRLSKAFGSTAETWLRMQLTYDLAAARKNEGNIRVRRQHIHIEELHVWSAEEERFLSAQADMFHPAEGAGWRRGAGANVRRKSVGLLRSK